MPMKGDKLKWQLQKLTNCVLYVFLCFVCLFLCKPEKRKKEKKTIGFKLKTIGLKWRGGGIDCFLSHYYHPVR